MFASLTSGRLQHQCTVLVAHRLCNTRAEAAKAAAVAAAAFPRVEVRLQVLPPAV